MSATPYGCGWCADGRMRDFEPFIVHQLWHINREIQKMTDQIEELQAADNAEGAAELRLATAVGALATQQSVFLADVKTALAGLGSNDQVTAIVNDITSRQAQLQALADQATQLAQDQASADPETAPTPVLTSEGDEVLPE